MVGARGRQLGVNMITNPIPLPSSGVDAFKQGFGLTDTMMKQIMDRKQALLHPSGDVANALYIEQLAKKVGNDHPAVIAARKAHQMGLDARQSLIGYRDVLNQTAGIRGTSTFGKTLAEGRGEGALDIVANYKGEPRKPLTPQEQQAYEQKIAKDTTDAEARNLFLRAQNLDKTRHSINVDDLVRYSGLPGTGNYLIESAKAAAGSPSKEFIAHQEAVNSASLMADQMRQFYKDSIQPSAMDRLRQLANPSTWYKNPQVAAAQWNQLNKILDQETETYKEMGTSPVKLQNQIDFKNGEFYLKENPKEETNRVQGEDDFLNAVVQKLKQDFPDVTPEAIRQAAKEENKTIEEVVQELGEIRAARIKK